MPQQGQTQDLRGPNKWALQGTAPAKALLPPPARNNVIEIEEQGYCQTFGAGKPDPQESAPVSAVVKMMELNATLAEIPEDMPMEDPIEEV